MDKELLEIENLSTAFLFNGHIVPVTKDITYKIKKGEILGVVGESGSGKSVTARTIMRLLPTPPSKILDGKVLFDGKDLMSLTEKEMRQIRGNKISMIFQEPMTSLNPVFTCGNQVVESIMLHQSMNKQEALKKAEELFRLVGIRMPKDRLRCYPHELSGGMRQRVMIAMALSCNPSLLIADEPTTALDPTIQAQILELIKEIHQKIGMSVMYITHDLSVVAEICHRVVVMYAGMVMEIADVVELFKNTLHPYTLGLMQAMPRLGEKKDKLYNIKGMVPHITRMPDGCRFNPRCPYATEKCIESSPELMDAGNGHMVRCFNYTNLVNGETV